MKTLTTIISHDNPLLLEECLVHHFGLADTVVFTERLARDSIDVCHRFAVPPIYSAGNITMFRDAAFRFFLDTDYDVLILIEDDAFTVNSDWKERWTERAVDYGVVALYSDAKKAADRIFSTQPSKDDVCGSVIAVTRDALNKIGLHNKEFYAMTPEQGWGYCDSEWLGRWNRVMAFSYGIEHALSKYKKWYATDAGLKRNKEIYERLLLTKSVSLSP